MEQRWHRRRIEPSAAAPVGPVTQSERHAADNHSHPGLSARKVIMILNDASVIIRHRGDLISIHVEGVRAAMAAGNDLVVSGRDRDQRDVRGRVSLSHPARRRAHRMRLARRSSRPADDRRRRARDLRRYACAPHMNARRLGSYDVFPIALGCMGMSGMYGAADENESIATIHEAIDRGINVLDTGDFYGMGHNEMLIGRAIRDRRDRVLLSVKFGAMRGPDAAWLGFDARPVAVKNFLAYSLTRLGVDHIDIYRPARLDPGA